MKVRSGVTHPLVGTDTRCVATTPRAPDAPGQRRERTPHRPRGVTLLSLAAGAALLGCSSLTSTPWRVEPAYRVQAGHPNPAQGYLALARQYEGEQRKAQALDAYRNAAKAAPADAEVQNTVGLALARHGQFAAAVAALRRAVALAPERAQLLNNLGYALLLDGRAEDARAMLRLTLAVNPAHEAASRNLAYLEQQLSAVAGKTAAPVAAVSETAAPLPTAGPAPAATPEAASAMPEQAPSNAPAQDSVALEPQALPGAADDAAGRAELAARARLDGVSIEILNGNGVGGAASRLRVWLRERGIEAGRLANLLPYNSAQTLVLYRAGNAGAAHEVAASMPWDTDVAPAPAGSTRADLRVVIGHDARHRAGCNSLAMCATPERVASSADGMGRGPGGDGKARP